MLITALTQSIEYLAGRSRLVYALMGLYYKSIIRQEAHLAGISSKDKILCIGGGPCPYTAILLHKLTGAPVTVIDNNRFCVQKSLGLIKRLNLQDEIKVLCSEGMSFPIFLNKNRYNRCHMWKKRKFKNETYCICG